MTLGALGQIGNGGGRGYECHNALAVDPESGELLGLVAQQLHNRARTPAGEGVAAGRDRDSRESLLWVNAARQIGPAPAGCHWVDVCDRGADTFEFLEHELRHGRHFVIRSTHSRALEVESEGRPHRLHDLLRPCRARLGWTVAVSANKGQPARTARVLCSWAEVTLKAPHVRRGRHGREPLVVWALRVWEVDAPAGVKEPLEWLLLTDEAIADGAAARQRVGYYERRPRVEDYHKAQKTGLGVERLQLQSQAGLQPTDRPVERPGGGAGQRAGSGAGRGEGGAAGDGLLRAAGGAGAERVALRRGAAADGAGVHPGVGAAGRAPQPQVRRPARLADAVAGGDAAQRHGRVRTSPAGRGGGARASPPPSPPSSRPSIGKL